MRFTRWMALRQGVSDQALSRQKGGAAEGGTPGGRGASRQPQLLSRNPGNTSPQQRSQRTGAQGPGKWGAGSSWKLPQAQNILSALCSFSPNWKDHIFPPSLHSGQFRCALQRRVGGGCQFPVLFGPRGGEPAGGRGCGLGRQALPRRSCSCSETFSNHPHSTLKCQRRPLQYPSPEELTGRWGAPSPAGTGRACSPVPSSGPGQLRLTPHVLWPMPHVLWPIGETWPPLGSLLSHWQREAGPGWTEGSQPAGGMRAGGQPRRNVRKGHQDRRPQGVVHWAATGTERHVAHTPPVWAQATEPRTRTHVLYSGGGTDNKQ